MSPPAGCRVRRPHTLNSTSTSKSFQSTVTGELNAPYSKQFVHSKSSQYRKMKTEWKSNVYLARSRIQVRTAASPGRGGGRRGRSPRGAVFYSPAIPLPPPWVPLTSQGVGTVDVPPTGSVAPSSELFEGPCEGYKCHSFPKVPSFGSYPLGAFFSSSDGLRPAA